MKSSFPQQAFMQVKPMLIFIDVIFEIMGNQHLEMQIAKGLSLSIYATEFIRPSMSGRKSLANIAANVILEGGL